MDDLRTQGLLELDLAARLACRTLAGYRSREEADAVYSVLVAEKGDRRVSEGIHILYESLPSSHAASIFV